MKPKCTIFNGWTGPECGKDAVSMNDYGGFQCEFHDGLPRCHLNKAGPHTPINKNDANAELRLEEAYDKYLQSEHFKSYKAGGKVVIAAHNAPQNMLRSNKE